MNVAEHTIGIVGVGLIGGSIAVALRDRGFEGRLIGVSRDPERLASQHNADALNHITAHVAEAAAECSLLIFCTPVDAIIQGVRSIADRVQPGMLLTDVGSAKATICNELAAVVPQSAAFVGSHPLAGSEKQGIQYACPDLFRDRCCVITPTAATPADQCDRLAAFWRHLGAEVVRMTPEDHDVVLAETSHLPHVAAAALSSQLETAHFPFAATGFRDTTRIAAGDADIWTAILEQNGPAIISCLDRYLDQLGKFRDAIASQDASRLKILLEAAKRNRDALD